MRTIKRSTNIIKKLYEGLGNYLSPSNFTYMWSLGSIVLIYLIIIILILLKEKIKKLCKALAVRKKKSRNTANNNKYYVDNLVQKEQKKITTVVAKEKYGYLFFLNKKKYKYNLKNKIIKRNYYASKVLYSGGKSGILTRWFYERMSPTKRLGMKTTSIKTNIKKTTGDYLKNKNNISEKEQWFLNNIKSNENIWKIWLNLTEKQQKIILNYFVKHVSFLYYNDDLYLVTNITTSQSIKENFESEIETTKPIAAIYVERNIISKEIHEYLMKENINFKNKEDIKDFKEIIKKYNENNYLDEYKDHLLKIYGNKMTEEEMLDSFYLLYYFNLSKPIRIKSEELYIFVKYFKLKVYDYDNYKIGEKNLNKQLPEKDLIIYFKSISENEKLITDFSDDIDIHDIILKINN